MITIAYDFKNREARDLEQINLLLAAMKLQDLEIEDFHGYLATTRDAQGSIIQRRYGLDRGSLVCSLAESQDGYTYQINTAVTEEGEYPDRDSYIDLWRSTHPERILRTVYTVEFNRATAYTIVHHERK